MTGPSAPAVLEWGSRIRLHVLEAGLACCAVEVSAAVARREATDPPPDGRRFDVLLVSGTVTDRALPGLLAAYAALPNPHVVAYGACTATGGPYWDSYSVTKGIDQVLPVDLFIPGCPPRPEALSQGLARLEVQLLQKGVAEEGVAEEGVAEEGPVDGDAAGEGPAAEGQE